MSLSAGTSFLSWVVADKLILKRVCERFPRYSRLDPIEKLRFKSYLASLVNAALLFGWSVKKQLEPRPKKEDEMEREAGEGLAVAGYYLGELLYDSVTTIDVIRHRPAEIFHHAAGISVLGLFVAKKMGGRVMRDLMLVELSTVFMDLLWLQESKGKMHKFLSLGFFLSFFLTRVAFFPFFIKKYVDEDPEVQSLWKSPFFKFLVYGLVALQYFWFAQIAAGAYRILTGKE